MDATLQQLLWDRAEGDPDLGQEAKLLILSAAQGRDALDAALGRVQPGETLRPQVLERSTGQAMAYLGRVEVEGFRGIGPRAVLPLEPGPGVTLVVGRNGSGKSSFAEAIEILLTGENQRWAHRSMIWREGWRNLHRPSPVEVVAHFAVEGTNGPTTIRRRCGLLS